MANRKLIFVLFAALTVSAAPAQTVIKSSSSTLMNIEPNGETRITDLRYTPQAGQNGTDTALVLLDGTGLLLRSTKLSTTDGLYDLFNALPIENNVVTIARTKDDNNIADFGSNLETLTSVPFYATHALLRVRVQTHTERSLLGTLSTGVRVYMADYPQTWGDNQLVTYIRGNMVRRSVNNTTEQYGAFEAEDGVLYAVPLRPSGSNAAFAYWVDVVDAAVNYEFVYLRVDLLGYYAPVRALLKN